MLGCGAAAAAVDIHQSLLEHLPGHVGEGLGCLVVSAHHVGQTRIGMYADAAWGHRSEFPQPRQQLSCTEAAVQAYRKEVGMRE